MADLNNNVFTLNKYVEFVLDGLVGRADWNTAWVAAGYTPAALSTIDRIIFSTNVNTATARGRLSRSTYGAHAGTTTSDAWYPGGFGPGPDAVTITDRLIYSNDTATTTTKGNLSENKTFGGYTQNLASDMWIGGGTLGPGPARVSRTERIIFASDTATGVQKGNLPTAAALRAGIHDFSANGWYACKEAPASNIVEKIVFASDTAAGVSKGPLSSSRYAATSGVSITTDGWVAGGRTPGSVTTVDRIIFASDTATAVVKGPLAIATNQSGGTATSTYGLILGGPAPAGSAVQKIIFASDTATAITVGPLSSAKYGVAAAI